MGILYKKKLTECAIMYYTDNKKNVLVLAAHPDDETLGCGATLNRLAAEGYNIDLITFTNGESARGGTDKNRNFSLEEVSTILGINNYVYGDFPDNAMDKVSLLDICKFLETNVIRTPDIIFTHFINDLNVDHQLVAKATFTVFRPQFGDLHKIYSYFVPSSTDYNPTALFGGDTYFNISVDNLNAKLAALNVYDSEMRVYPHTRSYENVKNLTKVWGSEVGTMYAEKFKLIRQLL